MSLWRHQFLEGLDLAHAEGEFDAVRQIGVEEGDVHLERLRAQGGGRADAAEADDAERALGEAPAVGIEGGAPVADRVGAQALVVEGDALGEGQHQRDGVVRDLARAVVRGVADRDAGIAPGLQVHVVETDRRLHHDAALPYAREVLGRRRDAHDGVALAPLLVGDLVEAAAELCSEAFAQRLDLHFLVAAEGPWPQYAIGHLSS